MDSIFAQSIGDFWGTGGIGFFVDIALHLDRYLEQVLSLYGVWIYAILFLVLFVETGLVVMPFLPGDSLLLVAGALWAAADMSVMTLMLVLITAAVLGDACNYSVGRFFGQQVFTWQDSRLFRRKVFDVAHAFYLQHGGKTIVLARFMPFVRTFAPFVAGVVSMPYRLFFAFNLLGGILWVGSLTLIGYWLGGLPVIKNNIALVSLIVVILSVLPLVLAWWRGRKKV